VPEQKAPRPRRTRGHIIAAQSVNYLEKFFIDKGHAVTRPAEDYGFDLLVNTFDEEGYLESGDVSIQLKASDSLRYSSDRTFISFSITIKHYESWTHELLPVFLVLYDALEKRAFWLYVQRYFAEDPARKPKGPVRSLTLRVPVDQEFTEATVDYARGRKAAILGQIAGEVDYHG
jgi:hypothetical protein